MTPTNKAWIWIQSTVWEKNSGTSNISSFYNLWVNSTTKITYKSLFFIFFIVNSVWHARGHNFHTCVKQTKSVLPAWAPGHAITASCVGLGNSLHPPQDVRHGLANPNRNFVHQFLVCSFLLKLVKYLSFLLVFNCFKNCKVWIIEGLYKFTCDFAILLLGEARLSNGSRIIFLNFKSDN